MTNDPADISQQALGAYRKGELDRAIQLLQRARREFAEQDRQMEAAEAANNLSVALLLTKQPQAALEAVEGTPELFDGLGEEERAAKAYGNLAAALEAVGDLSAAEGAYREAAERFDRLGDRESRTHTLKALSQLQLRDRRPYEAAATFQAGLEGDRPSGIRARLARTVLKLTSRLLRS